MQKNIIIIITFISGLILGAIFFSKETSIYAQPSIVTEQARVLDECMAGYGRTLELLKDSNELLEEIIK